MTKRLTPKREQKIRNLDICNNVVPELLSEIDSLRSEASDLRADLECNNRTCTTKYTHHNVWCDHIIQRDLLSLITERDCLAKGLNERFEQLYTLMKERDQLKYENEKLKELNRESIPSNS